MPEKHAGRDLPKMNMLRGVRRTMTLRLALVVAAALSVTPCSIAAPAPDVVIEGTSVGGPGELSCDHMDTGTATIRPSAIPNPPAESWVTFEGPPVAMFASCAQPGSLPPGVVPDVGTIPIAPPLDLKFGLPLTFPGNCLRLTTSEVAANTTEANRSGGLGWLAVGTPVNAYIQC